MLKGLEALRSEVKFDFFGKKIDQWSSYLGEIFDEPPIEASIF